MTDIVLISPKYDMNKIMRGQREELEGRQHNIQLSPSLGLAYLAGYLEREGFEVKIIDATVDSLSPEKLTRTVERISPSFIGVSVTSFSLYYTRTLIKKLKEKLKSTIIVGGPHITCASDSTIRLGADYGIVAEGEKGLTALLRSLNNGWNLDNIPGLVWQKGNKLLVNTPECIENLDELPLPARHLLPMDRYYHGLCPGRVVTVLISRGCPYGCIFCATPFARSYRVRSSPDVIKEIEELLSRRIQWIKFEDDVFTFANERIE
jgi:magnesium-protoporphyrin IX monomethyl ester (oxidative) cyclase